MAKPPPRSPKAKSKPGPARARSKRGGAPGALPATAPANVSGAPAASAPAAASADGASSDAPAFTVVGVGASAGGLEAFTQLLRAVPADSNLAIVYVQHLAPRQESLLSRLLADATALPVVQVTHGMRLEPKRVYVIPPNTFMTVSLGALWLTPRPADRSQHLPIDHFFRSLAEWAQGRAAGVILSGTDVDGSAGLREIKSAGGITFAQEPATARFDGMPRAAVATGAVDSVLPPEEIARELGRIILHPLLRHRRADGAGADDVPIADEHWRRVFALLRNASGVDFTHYKQPTIRRRLQRRMVLHRIANIEQYLLYLQQTPAEATALYQDILIHVTRFFREPDSYEMLARRVFPSLRRPRGDGHPLRIWVPGCSTGEEVYSVAISLLEFLGEESNATAVQIFGTDVSELAVEQARAGVYPGNIAGDVSPERLRRFFHKVDGSFRVSKTVRDLCIFARQDLTRDPPFSRLDLIVCRNVLIYLGPVLQKKLMNVFHYALKPGGFLLVGSSETIGPQSDLFAMADKKHRLYAKKSSDLRMSMDFPPGSRAPAAEAAPKPSPDGRGGAGVLHEANRVVLTRYSPAGVVVDDALQIVQFRGQTGPYLEPAPGEASLNLLKMAREGLLYDLRAALHEARRSGAPVRREGVRVRHDGRVLGVNLEVAPLIVAGDERHFLVLFEEARGEARVPPPAAGDGKARGGKKGAPPRAPEDGDGRTLRLRQELAASREYLQSIIQDLEAANEELQSANEEILSSNEELQSTNEELDTAKEELQSTNEELNTVNEELQSRNEELGRANSDMLNLLSSVQIAVVMVSGDLRVRRFTPMAERVLNLIPTDVGRPIGDIKPNLDLPDLEKLILESVDTVSVIEREVTDRDGGPFLLRIRPYKNLENRIDGAVLAVFDLEVGRRGGRYALDAKAAVDGLVAVAREPVLVLDGQARVVAANAAFDNAFGAVGVAGVGRPVYDLGDGRWNIPRLRQLLEQTLPRERELIDYRLDREFPGPGGAGFTLNARVVDRGSGDMELIVLSFQKMVGESPKV